MRVVVFWDSICEGFWDYETWGWINILKTYLWKNYGYDYMLINYWVSAYTSENILKIFQHFFDACSRREPWKEKESMIVIAIGINDCSIIKSTWKPRVSKEQFSMNIESIIKQCKQDKLIQRIILVSNINVDEDVINSDVEWEHLFLNKNIQEYNSILQNACKQNNLEFIDMFWIMEKDDLEDWLHPNTKWHRKMFEKVRIYLKV